MSVIRRKRTEVTASANQQVNSNELRIEKHPGKTRKQIYVDILDGGSI